MSEIDKITKLLGEDADVAAKPLPIAKRLVGSALQDALIGGGHTGVHVNPNEGCFSRGCNAQGAEGVVAKRVEADR